MGIKRIGGGMAVNQITEGVIWKQLLIFFFPILFGTFFQQLYNTADAVIVGQFVGTQALAAVGGATGSLINFFVNLFVGLASGTTVVIAQAYTFRTLNGDPVEVAFPVRVGARRGEARVPGIGLRERLESDRLGVPRWLVPVPVRRERGGGEDVDQGSGARRWVPCRR